MKEINEFLDKVPGFRTRTPWKMVLSAIYYMSGVYAIFDFKAEDYNPAVGLIMIIVPIAVCYKKNNTCNIQENNKINSKPKINSGELILPDVRPTKTSKYVLKEFVAIDTETTGLNYKKEKLIEVCALKIKDGEIVDKFNELINPKCHIPSGATKVNNITDDMVKDCRTVEEVLPEFIKFIGDNIIVGHNVTFDLNFITPTAHRLGYTLTNEYLDTLSFARRMFKDVPNHKLGTLIKHLNIETGTLHRAYADTKATVDLYYKCLEAKRNKKKVVETV